MPSERPRLTIYLDCDETKTSLEAAAEADDRAVSNYGLCIEVEKFWSLRLKASLGMTFKQFPDDIGAEKSEFLRDNCETTGRKNQPSNFRNSNENAWFEPDALPYAQRVKVSSSFLQRNAESA